MKRMLVGFIILVSLLLGGCASTYTEYKMPSDGLGAKVRFLNTFRANQQVHVRGSVYFSRTDLTNCPRYEDLQHHVVLKVTRTPWSRDEDKEISPIQMIGTSTVADANIRERVIEAGKLFPFEIFSSYSGDTKDYGVYKETPIYSCTILGSFIPGPSDQYEIDHTVSVGPQVTCSAKIYKLSIGPDGKAVRSLDATQRYYKHATFCQLGRN